MRKRIETLKASHVALSFVVFTLSFVACRSHIVLVRFNFWYISLSDNFNRTRGAGTGAGCREKPQVTLLPQLYLITTSTVKNQSIMEEFVADEAIDEVESILYIAREISGMPHALPHDVPV